MITAKMYADPVIKDLRAVSQNLTKELRVVSWKVASKTKSLISKAVTSELATPQKTVRKQISSQRVEPTGAEVTLKKSSRISLKEFGARQTKKGVSYRISKRKGRTTLPGAFKGPRPGLTTIKLNGHVFSRVGKERMPITKLYGPSPWGVFVKNDMKITAKVNFELRKQLAERLRYRKLKNSGAI